MIDVTKNINLTISQYQKAHKLKTLITSILSLIQKQQIDIIYTLLPKLSLDNADNWFLSRIGDNHGYKRPVLFDEEDYLFFGFDGWGKSFDQAPFFFGQVAPTIKLDDALYRKLLKAWILGLFDDGSTYNLNKILSYAFGQDCYAVDKNNLTVSIYLSSTYNTEQQKIIFSVLPKVAGVHYQLESI